MYCEPDFLSLLSDFHADVLERHQGAIYGIWPDGVLAYVNPAWLQFARDNAGGSLLTAKYWLGWSIYPAMCGELKRFYTRSYHGCLESQTLWRHDYDCSSPDECRRFQMLVYPLKREGMLIVNAQIAEHLPTVGAIDRKEYLTDGGIVNQCRHCHRFETTKDPHRWHAVPAWANDLPANVSHSLCPICLCHFHPDLAPELMEEVLGTDL
jgi:hypothetical protein